MTRNGNQPLVQFLRGLGAHENLKSMSDVDLLQRFTNLQDETAFSVMVRRHGGIVFQVCRTLLSDPADADDAFQATFLVLARRAHAIRKKNALASWLYGVAYRTCLKARATVSVRRHHEMQRGSSDLLRDTAGKAEATGTCPRIESRVLDELTWREARCILHEELARLPEKYRAPLVLCYLEGRRQDDAERLLGWPAGKLRSMLERARQRFRTHLIKRGLGPILVLVLAAGEARSAAVPQGLVRAATSLGSPSAAVATVPPRVHALGDLVIRSMTLRQGKLALGVMVLAALSGTIAAGLTWLPPADEPPTPTAHVPASVVFVPEVSLMPRVINVQARASSWWDQYTPDAAFHRNGQSMWNAGSYAPHWIEADLGRAMQLGSIVLTVSQLPDGETTHELWVSDEPVGGAGLKIGMTGPVAAPAGDYVRDQHSPAPSSLKHDPGDARTMTTGVMVPTFLDPTAHRAARATAKLVHSFEGYTKQAQKLRFDFPAGTQARYVQILTTRSPSWIGWSDIDLRASAR
jgi:RNA polymerase sigma factor (sigma-70 family)